MKYLTASRSGKPSERRASVHLIEVGPPARFIATCHRNHDLRWFRVDGIVRAHVDDAQKVRDWDAAHIAAFRKESLDGFKAPVRWSNAPSSYASRIGLGREKPLDRMQVESLHGGVRVSIETSALVPLACFVVRLGDVARPETRALADPQSTRNALIGSASCGGVTNGKAIAAKGRKFQIPAGTTTAGTRCTPAGSVRAESACCR
jgi:hypothetical protein